MNDDTDQPGHDQPAHGIGSILDARARGTHDARPPLHGREAEARMARQERCRTRGENNVDSADDFIQWLREQGFEHHFTTQATLITGETKPARIDLDGYPARLTAEVTEAAGAGLMRSFFEAKDNVIALRSRLGKLPPAQATDHLLAPDQTLRAIKAGLRLISDNAALIAAGNVEAALRRDAIRRTAEAAIRLRKRLRGLVQETRLSVEESEWLLVDAMAAWSEGYLALVGVCRAPIDVERLFAAATAAGVDARLLERIRAVDAQVAAQAEAGVFVREMRTAWVRSVAADPDATRFHGGAGLVQAFFRNGSVVVRDELYDTWHLWLARHSPASAAEPDTAAYVRAMFSVCCTAVRWARHLLDRDEIAKLLGHLLRQDPADRGAYVVPARWMNDGFLKKRDVGVGLTGFFNLTSGLRKGGGAATTRRAWQIDCIGLGVILRDAAAAARLRERLGDAWPIALVSKTAASWQEEKDMKKMKVPEEPISMDGNVVRREMTARIAAIANYMRVKKAAPAGSTLPIESMASHFFHDAAPHERFSSRALRGTVASRLLGSTVDELVLQAADELRADAERLRLVFCRAWTKQGSWEVFQMLDALRDASPEYRSSIWSPIAVAAGVAMRPADMDANCYFAG